MRNPIITAIDVPTIKQANTLVDCLGDQTGAFKIGLELFTAAGPEIIRHIRKRGIPVCLDLKYHDIPNTVAAAVRAAIRLDTQMLTIHTSGGLNMMRSAAIAAKETAAQLGLSPPLLLGVSVLTSMDDKDIQSLGIHRPVAVQVRQLIALGMDAGLQGFVCSPQETARLRQTLPPEIKLACPGIRMDDNRPNDQKRTMTPAQALQAGADYLVIGRPICAAPDPPAALERVLQSIQPTNP